jgi:hypothetical protein
MTSCLSDSAKPGKVHETQLEGDAPYGQQFFAADVGVPALIEEFGGGDVGGNDYKDALFHAGPRGKNKPKITDVAVVKLPSMATVERGHHDYRRPDGTMASDSSGKTYKTGPWTPEEDEKLKQLAAAEKEGARGRWVRFSAAMNRSPSDCSLRWNQVLNPIDGSEYRDILQDSFDPKKDWGKKYLN